MSQQDLENALIEVSKLIDAVLHGVSKFSGDKQEFIQSLTTTKKVLEQIADASLRINEAPNNNKP